MCEACGCSERPQPIRSSLQRRLGHLSKWSLGRSISLGMVAEWKNVKAHKMDKCAHRNKRTFDTTMYHGIYMICCFLFETISSCSQIFYVFCYIGKFTIDYIVIDWGHDHKLFLLLCQKLCKSCWIRSTCSHPKGSSPEEGMDQLHNEMPKHHDYHLPPRDDFLNGGRFGDFDTHRTYRGLSVKLMYIYHVYIYIYSVCWYP